jgi:hypothetical protein
MDHWLVQFFAKLLNIFVNFNKGIWGCLMRKKTGQ